MLALSKETSASNGINSAPIDNPSTASTLTSAKIAANSLSLLALTEA